MIPVRVQAPITDVRPIVVDSPHSGFDMPSDFGTIAGLEALRSTWDAFVDELWGDAPSYGATLVAATFPRAYIDVNRRTDDIDPVLLAEPWPAPLSPSDYSRRGMGLIRRLALPDVPMYATPLSVAAVSHRLSHYYEPYRDAINVRIAELRAAHDLVLLLNVHSMKSQGNAMNVDVGVARPDVVVSDRHGTTADPRYTAMVADSFRSAGYSVQRNEPYQGGDVVRTFGAPSRGIHAIQIEVNRALYMDEATCTRGPGFARLRAACASCIRMLAERVSQPA